MDKIKVMIVDDEVAMREVLKLMLKDFTVIEATNGKEALELFKNERPDIILIDIMMPIMNGIDATREIKKIDPNAKVVAITAYATSKGDKMVAAGADYILRKPFTRKEVITLIKKIVGGS